MTTDTPLSADLVTTNVTHVELSHPATESYMSFETHKCAAVAHAQYQLFALFPPSVPNHSMRSVLRVPLANLSNCYDHHWPVDDFRGFL